MLLAARALAEEAGNAALSVNGAAAQGPAGPRRSSPAEVKAGALTIANESDAPVDAVVSVIGAALTPEPAVSKGFTIERTYYTLDGKKVDLASATGGTGQLKQNDRLVVVLKVDAPETGGRILLVDRLPAGLEIENPRLVDSGDIKTLAWLKTTREAAAHRVPRRPLRRRLRLLRRSTGGAAGATPTATRRAASPAIVGHGRLPRARGDAGLVRASRRRRWRTCTAPTASPARPPAASTSRPKE